jgi:hypothetical protein
VETPASWGDFNGRAMFASAALKVRDCCCEMRDSCEWPLAFINLRGLRTMRRVFAEITSERIVEPSTRCIVRPRNNEGGSHQQSLSLSLSLSLYSYIPLTLLNIARGDKRSARRYSDIDRKLPQTDRETRAEPEKRWRARLIYLVSQRERFSACQSVRQRRREEG